MEWRSCEVHNARFLGSCTSVEHLFNNICWSGTEHGWRYVAEDRDAVENQTDGLESCHFQLILAKMITV